ncbi:MAG TPA: PfkB family carbohydrate kinase, partial [Planctomycetota bacterium]|nr:PfkB family carbohydrate kinase [Planctomycetota bacterium]
MAVPASVSKSAKPTMNLQLDLDALFPKIRATQVAILGDFCLDHYLFLDPDFKEISVETGLPVRGVATQQYSPGGAGNVAANVAALGVSKAWCLGCIGEDPYGISLVRCLEKIGCDVAGLVVQNENWSTRAYVKPYVGTREESRFDHGVANKITDATVRKIVAQLEKILPRLNAVILNEQVAAGIWNELLFSEVNRLAAQYPQVAWVVDSRHSAERFHGVILKVNANEAARMHGRDVRFGEAVRQAESEADLQHLYAKTKTPVVITRSEQGALAIDGKGAYAVPGVHIIDEIDIVGAGDTFCSALASSLGAKAPVGDAILLANWAASVTVRKLRQTGTASEAEIRRVAADVDYIYEPELAVNPRHAQFAEGLDLEIITGRPAAKITCAIFDFDGTISTLREGWEQVMAPMMTKAILGDRFADADDRTFERVRARVHAYIDQSTGIPTLQQMLGLIKLVRDFGFVPETKILDIHGYKQIYNEALMSMVHERVERLERGERSVQDFLIKGAVEFLTALRERGVSLTLASGTDVEDVQREAEILGVAKLFDGGIRGSTKDPQFNSKRAVLEKLVAEHAKDSRQAAGILACGDGPVELREVRKRGGFALGVASDEVRRFGWHTGKRTRLIRAGANVLV